MACWGAGESIRSVHSHPALLAFGPGGRVGMSECGSTLGQLVHPAMWLGHGVGTLELVCLFRRPVFVFAVHAEVHL